MKHIITLTGATLLSLCVSGAFAADGGTFNATSRFTIVSAAKCIPTIPAAFTFADISTESAESTYNALSNQTLILNNCPAGTAININATSNMNALDGSSTFTSSGGPTKDRLGVQILAASSNANANSMVVMNSRGTGVDITLTTANTISLFAKLKPKNNYAGGGLKDVTAATYSIDVPLTVTLK